MERTGGFAGMRVLTTIDTETLPPEQARELESLVEAASFFELPARAKTTPSGADHFNYRISIEAEGRKHTVETSDEVAPETLRPLLRRLTALARSRGNSPR
jgi:hypothetical protein